jgi:hypothetical protein
VEWRFRDFPTSGTIAALPLVKQLTGLGYPNTHSFCGGLLALDVWSVCSFIVCSRLKGTAYQRSAKWAGMQDNSVAAK